MFVHGPGLILRRCAKDALGEQQRALRELVQIRWPKKQLGIKFCGCGGLHIQKVPALLQISSYTHKACSMVWIAVEIHTPPAHCTVCNAGYMPARNVTLGIAPWQRLA
eukprot:Gb_38550 [translate_table: standard]